jgi:hypothetical protein
MGMQVEIAAIGRNCLSGTLTPRRDRRVANKSSLPFIEDNDCGLAIIVRTYFDELVQQPDTTVPEVKKDMKMKSQGYFQHIDSFGDNLDLAFKLWDAVSL